MNTSLQDMVSVYNAQGRLAGEMIKAFLESYGIESILTQESAAAIYGLTVGALGIVEVLVAAEQADAARQLLISMEEGTLSQNEILDKDEFDEFESTDQTN